MGSAGVENRFAAERIGWSCSGALGMDGWVEGSARVGELGDTVVGCGDSTKAALLRLRARANGMACRGRKARACTPVWIHNKRGGRRVGALMGWLDYG